MQSALGQIELLAFIGSLLSLYRLLIFLSTFVHYLSRRLTYLTYQCAIARTIILVRNEWLAPGRYPVVSSLPISFVWSCMLRCPLGLLLALWLSVTLGGIPRRAICPCDYLLAHVFTGFSVPFRSLPLLLLQYDHSDDNAGFSPLYCLVPPVMHFRLMLEPFVDEHFVVALVLELSLHPSSPLAFGHAYRLCLARASCPHHWSYSVVFWQIRNVSIFCHSCILDWVSLFLPLRRIRGLSVAFFSTLSSGCRVHPYHILPYPSYIS